MDETDAVPRPRRQRPKDSFQNELQSKLRQRKNLGLGHELTDSDDDVLGSRTTEYHTSQYGRPGSAKRRPDHSPDLSRGLGTRTMGSRDLTRMLGHSLSDEEDVDEEIMKANFGRASPGGSKMPGGRTTPSPQLDSKYLRKKPSTTTESPKEQTGKLDSIFGRKTPTKETPSSGKPLSKEDIIFGRTTPISDGKKSPYDGSQRRLPGVDGDKPWQPPSYRNVSPSSSPTEHSRGSHGVTPVDSVLESISESPKVTPRKPRGDWQSSLLKDEGKPKPQARSRVGERKTPPIVDPRRTSPTSQKEAEIARKRSTPTVDLFGRSRSVASQEVDEYMDADKDKKEVGRKTPTSTYGRAQTPEAKKGRVGFQDKEPAKSGGSRFMRDNRKSPATERKTPTSSLDRKSPLTKKSSEEERAKGTTGSTLLDFLMEDTNANKPKPQERGKKLRDKENDKTLDDMFGSGRKSVVRSKSTEGRKSPGPSGKKSPEPVAQPQEMFKTIPKQQRPEDTSSLCEEIPPDPNRKINREGEGPKTQTSEKAQAEEIIDTIAVAQTMKYIEPAKKMRPVTANAKVQHRPKPRYGTLTGDKTKTLQERQFNSTGDIRDAIYEEWYKERMRSAKQKKREEERKAKEEEEKKNKEKEEKKLEAQMSYKAWEKAKKEELQRQHEKKEEEERMKREKEEQEKQEKKIESVKSFESWKKKKDSMIKRELHKKEEEKRREEEEKKREEYEKRKDRETAFRGWKTKKEKEHIQQIHNKKKEENMKRTLKEQEEDELRRKEEEAMQRYNDWVEEKERKTKLEKKRAKRLMMEEEYKPAWSPASRTIPFGR